ncbi:MAG: hypothetical protein CME32_29460 [Gimesia sp.]|nr:hypothetical protein [Gimesia sp.]HCR37381.1 hypothetical protein [Opitutae bacterium]|tara:strand:- start:1214 stop:1753 length:540 start_codon:yes stop_codon:yes gene_type:complete
MSQGVFLDRDGTLIEHVPYLSDPKAVKLLPGASEALKALQALGYKLFLFTNQSGVGRGYFTMDAVHACNDKMFDLLGIPKADFANICIAPEAPDAPTVYRKPSPKFIHEMIEAHKLDPQACYMIGDSVKDIEAGIRAGIHSVFINNPTLPEGEGLNENHIGKVARYPNLKAFVDSLGTT